MKIIRILSILLCMALAPGALAGCTYTLLEPSPADVGTGGGETDPHTPESADNTDETETYVFPEEL